MSDFHRAVSQCSAASEREHVERALESTRIAAQRNPRALNATLPSSIYVSPSFTALRDNVLSPCTQQNSVLSFKRDPVSSRSNAFLLLRHYVSVFQMQQSLRLLLHRTCTRVLCSSCYVFDDAAIKQRAIYALAHDTSLDPDTDGNTETFSELVVDIAESWGVLAKPVSENLALFNSHERQLEVTVIEAHNKIRVAEADLLFALVTAWSTVICPPMLVQALCSALHRSSEATQDAFFSVCCLFSL